jgi:hypothetical protein
MNYDSFPDEPNRAIIAVWRRPGREPNPLFTADYSLSKVNGLIKSFCDKMTTSYAMISEESHKLLCSVPMLRDTSPLTDCKENPPAGLSGPIVPSRCAP